MDFICDYILGVENQAGEKDEGLKRRCRKVTANRCMNIL